MKLILSLLTLVALTLVQPSAATVALAKQGVITLDASQTKAIKKLNAYINSFKSLRGDFVQISPKGQTTRGVFFLSKPGKIRFEYAPPNQLLIVADGRWLTMTNRKMDRGDQVPLKATPLRLIVSEKIDLLKEVDIIGMEEAGGLTTVAIADKKDRQNGHIVLVYDSVQNTLQQWVVVDGRGRRTTVQFANLETDVKVDPKLFNAVIKRKEK